MSRRNALQALAVLALILGFPVAGQLTSSISVGYVLVPFTAFDGKGRPLADLEKGDVELFVDGSRVATDLFDRSVDAPVSYTILLDASGSMGLAGKMEGARAAIEQLLAMRRDGDDYALWLFTHEGLREAVPFTRETGRILSAFDEVTPWGKTPVFDALAAAPAATLVGENGSRVIILLTDGIDNASALSREELAGRLQGIEVPIYPLALRRESPATPEEGFRDDILHEIAAFSGGRVVSSSDPMELRRAIAAMQNDLRVQYLVGFPPTGRGAAKYRRMHLRVARRGVSVHVREGYVGTEPPWSAPDTKGKKQ